MNNPINLKEPKIVKDFMIESLSLYHLTFKNNRIFSIDKILKDGNISFFFSDGHATDYLTKFYTKDDIQQISEILDRKAILARQWSGENIDRDIKRRKQAEFLVKQDIPHEYIVGCVCYNDTAKAKLLAWNIPDEIIRVKPTAYY